MPLLQAGAVSRLGANRIPQEDAGLCDQGVDKIDDLLLPEMGIVGDTFRLLTRPEAQQIHGIDCAHT